MKKGLGKYIRIDGIPGIHLVEKILDKGEEGLFYKTITGNWWPASKCHLTSETRASVETWTLRHKGGD